MMNQDSDFGSILSDKKECEVKQMYRLYIDEYRYKLSEYLRGLGTMNAKEFRDKWTYVINDRNEFQNGIIIHINYYIMYCMDKLTLKDKEDLFFDLHYTIRDIYSYLYTAIDDESFQSIAFVKLNEFVCRLDRILLDLSQM